MIRKAMVQLLSSLGYKPLTAGSLEEARESIGQTDDLAAVLVDHHLSSDDGFAAVPGLREDAQTYWIVRLCRNSSA